MRFNTPIVQKIKKIQPEKHVSLTYSDYDCFIDIEKFIEREWYRELCKNSQFSLYRSYIILEKTFNKNLDKKRAVFVLKFGKSLTPKQLLDTCN